MSFQKHLLKIAETQLGQRAQHLRALLQIAQPADNTTQHFFHTLSHQAFSVRSCQLDLEKLGRAEPDLAYLELFTDQLMPAWQAFKQVEEFVTSWLARAEREEFERELVAASTPVRQSRSIDDSATNPDQAHSGSLNLYQVKNSQLPLAKVTGYLNQELTKLYQLSTRLHQLGHEQVARLRAELEPLLQVYYQALEPAMLGQFTCFQATAAQAWQSPQLTKLPQLPQLPQLTQLAQSNPALIRICSDLALEGFWTAYAVNLVVGELVVSEGQLLSLLAQAPAVGSSMTRIIWGLISANGSTGASGGGKLTLERGHAALYLDTHPWILQEVQRANAENFAGTHWISQLTLALIKLGQEELKDGTVTKLSAGKLVHAVPDKLTRHLYRVLNLGGAIALDKLTRAKSDTAKDNTESNTENSTEKSNPESNPDSCTEKSNTDSNQQIPTIAPILPPDFSLLQQYYRAEFSQKIANLLELISKNATAGNIKLLLDWLRSFPAKQRRNFGKAYLSLCKSFPGSVASELQAWHAGYLQDLSLAAYTLPLPSQATISLPPQTKPASESAKQTPPQSTYLIYYNPDLYALYNQLARELERKPLTQAYTFLEL